MFRKARVVTLIILLTVGVGILWASPPAEREIYYYTDDTRTEMCGMITAACSFTRWTGNTDTDWWDSDVGPPCSTYGGEPPPDWLSQLYQCLGPTSQYQITHPCYPPGG